MEPSNRARKNNARCPVLTLLLSFGLLLAPLGCGFDDDLETDENALVGKQISADAHTITTGYLMLPQRKIVGKVQMWVEEYDLKISLQVDRPWLLQSADVVMISDWPTAPDHNKFAGSVDCEPRGRSCSLSIGLNASEAACFATLKVRVEAQIRGLSTAGSFLTSKAVAVSYAPKMIADVDQWIEKRPTCVGGFGTCTHSIAFWRSHNDYATVRAMQSPWPIDEDTALCDSTWLHILQRQVRGNAWGLLAQQWIAARLNVASGVEAPKAVTDALNHELVGVCRDLPALRRVMLTAAEQLQAFNEGAVGPGACKEVTIRVPTVPRPGPTDLPRIDPISIDKYPYVPAD